MKSSSYPFSQEFPNLPSYITSTFSKLCSRRMSSDIYYKELESFNFIKFIMSQEIEVQIKHLSAKNFSVKISQNGSVGELRELVGKESSLSP